MSKRYSKMMNRTGGARPKAPGAMKKQPSQEELLAAARAVLTEQMASAAKAPFCVISCSSRLSRPGRPVSVTVHYCLNEADVKCELEAAQKIHAQPGHLGFALDAAVAPNTIASYLIQEMERVFGGSAATTESCSVAGVPLPPSSRVDR